MKPSPYYAVDPTETYQGLRADSILGATSFSLSSVKRDKKYISEASSFFEMKSVFK